MTPDPGKSLGDPTMTLGRPRRAAFLAATLADDGHVCGVPSPVGTHHADVTRLDAFRYTAVLPPACPRTLANCSTTLLLYSVYKKRTLTKAIYSRYNKR